MLYTRFAILIGLTAFSASAAAYDFTCYPETEHDPSLLAPNIGFMLDQSGSMGFAATPTETRWEAARLAILETVQDFYTAGACASGTESTCDTARFGIGRFSFPDRTSWDIEVQEDAHDVPFDSALPATQEGGGTYTGAGAQALVNESSLNDPTRTNVGVFITDGLTETFSESETADQVRLAVNMLCTGRTRPNPLVTYIIAFGDDASGSLNDLYAAAGGTGTCEDAGGNPLDVCSLTPTEIEDMLSFFVIAGVSAEVDEDVATCTGSIDAVTPDDLKNQITQITSEAACTFPLDIPSGYPGGAALDDPEATLVGMNHSTYGTIGLGHIGDCDAPMGNDTETSINAVTGDPAQGAAYVNEGWCFADQTRLRVRLSDGLCGEITGGTIDIVTTQIACPCNLTGQSCTVTGLNCIDSAGGTSPCTNEQLQNMPCSSGVYECISGVDTCVATGAGVLPEICNGVDDNCDGLPDNVADTESAWSDPDDADGKHCNFDNTCQCPSGMTEAITTDGNLNTLLNTNYTGVCVCGSSLDYEDEQSPSVGEDGQSDAACASLGGFQNALLIWGVLLGFVFVARRRRD